MRTSTSELSISRRFLAAVVRINEMGQRSASLAELIARVRNSLGDVMPADGFYVSIYRAETDSFHFPSGADGFAPRLEDAALIDDLNRRVLQAGNTIFEPPASFGTTNETGGEGSSESAITNWLGVPMKCRGEELVGVVLVRADSSLLRFTEIHAEFLSFIAAQMVGVIERRQALLGDLAKTESQVAPADAAERALMESRRTLTTLLSNLPGMAYRCRNDRDWTLEFVSEGSLPLTGYLPADLIGKGRLVSGALIHPEDRDLVRRDIQSALAAHKAYELVYRIIPADGTTKWVREQVYGIHAGGIGAIAFEGFITDITERKRTEDSLRESDERLKIIFNAVRAGILIIDPETHLIVDANPVAVELIGGERSRIVGSVCHKHVCPAEIGRCPITDLGQSVDNSERKLLKSDGSSTPIIKTINSIVLDGKSFLIESFIDITERNRAEQELQSSERRYRGLFDGVPVGLFRTSAEGQLLDVNASLVNMLGYPSREALLAMNVRDTYANPPERAQWQEILHKDGLVRNYQYQLRRCDGTHLWVEETARAVRDEAGQVLHYEGSIVDITQNKRLESEFLQAQKMESIGVLAGGVAHDFNNLLTVIIGYCQFLESDYELRSDVQADVEQIKKAAERAASLTSQLLAFSRKQILQPVVLDLNGLISDMEEMLRRLIGEDVELQTFIQPGLGRVKADPGQIQQVLMNLAVNARDAMPQGGKLTIETANVDFDRNYLGTHPGSREGAHVMIAVTDSGCGMDAQTRARIFEPFFTTKGPSKGSGLGLSTVYGIIKQSDGYIWVDTEPGIGTAFKIYLPRNEEAPYEVTSPVLCEPGLESTPTVLLVDDDAAVRAMMRRILEEQGYCVLEGSNGADAMAAVGEFSGEIHLLITDVVMPGMDGRILASKVAVRRPGIRVLLISAYPHNEASDFRELDSKIAFLQKPFTAEGLILKVRESVRGANALIGT